MKIEINTLFLHNSLTKGVIRVYLKFKRRHPNKYEKILSNQLLEGDEKLNIYVDNIISCTIFRIYYVHLGSLAAYFLLKNILFFNSHRI